MTQSAKATIFLTLMDTEWSDKISSSFIRELYDIKLGKYAEIP